MQFGRSRNRKRYRKLDTNQEALAGGEAQLPEENKASAPAQNDVEAKSDETSVANEEPAAESATEEKKSEPDWKDLYARLLADFDNFKKRTARDREDIFRYAESDIIKDFLPVLDNLSLAISTAADKEDAFVKGVCLVYDTFLAALKSHGAEPFDSVGLELDTDRMEAIAQLPNEEVEEGKVSNEVKRGWMLKGKVLRAAQVVVSSGKGA